MKTLVIRIEEEEIRVFNEKNQNWEIQYFRDLEIEIMSNFATIAEEIQDKLNNIVDGDFEFETIIVFEKNNKTFQFKLFEDTAYVNGFENYNPETKEAFIVDDLGNHIFIGVISDWDYSDLALTKIEIPSEVDGQLYEVDGYSYELTQGDTDLYDVYNYLQR